MKPQLLTPSEVDELLRYPDGRAERMAKRGKLPHLLLPTGEVRFDASAIDRMLDLAKSQGRTDPADLLSIDPEAVYNDAEAVRIIGVPPHVMARERSARRIQFQNRGGRILYRGRWLLTWLAGPVGMKVKAELGLPDNMSVDAQQPPAGGEGVQ